MRKLQDLRMSGEAGTSLGGVMRLEGVWLLEIFQEPAWGQTREAFINDLSEIMKSLLMKPPLGIQLGNIVTVQENCSMIKRS